MPRRCVLVAATVLLSLGFAPAPPPRPQRLRAAIDLARFQGTWKVVGHHRWSGGQKLDNPWSITHIRVDKGRWTLLESGQENASYRIEIDPEKKPAHIDWRGARNEVLWQGLIRRDGDTVEIIYLSANRRPEGFDAPPSGGTVITLQRSR